MKDPMMSNLSDYYNEMKRIHTDVDYLINGYGISTNNLRATGSQFLSAIKSEMTTCERIMRDERNKIHN